MKVQDVGQKQGHKVKTDIMKEVEYLNNYVLKCWKVARMLINITHNEQVYDTVFGPLRIVTDPVIFLPYRGRISIGGREWMIK